MTGGTKGQRVSVLESVCVLMCERERECEKNEREKKRKREGMRE